MTFDKLCFQTRIDDLFNSSGNDWNIFQSSFVLDDGKSLALFGDLQKDAKSLYFKGMLTLVQGLSDCNKKLYSWATVKFYYSVFYFMRASLASKKNGFYRSGKNLYHLLTISGQRLLKADGRDHKAVIHYFQKNKNSDPIQHSLIDNMNAYEWLMEKRETVNYKHATFSEPNVDDIWADIHEYVRKNKVEKIITDIINDTVFSHCFMEEYAILAIPIKRMQETKKDMQSSGIINLIDEEKKQFLKTILKIDKDVVKKIIE